jgi:16S rRNA (guanine(966)-N(2))-methyltransferase RsmD
MSTLRVISGSARGRRLKTVPGETTRPITDRVKESLFNILGPDIKGSAILDLFAGTGAVGIEALSRGAKYAQFVDRNRLPIKIIQENLQTTGLAEKAQVLHLDAFVALKSENNCRFDYVYIAPPQYQGIWLQALQAIDNQTNLLHEDAWVIVQIHPKEYEVVRVDHLKEFDQRQYGSTLLVFYRFAQEDAI